MQNRLMRGVLISLAGVALAGAAWPQQLERELQATKRLFPDAGPGLRAIRRDAGGRYYTLSAPGTDVAVYDASGKRVGQVPGTAESGASIVYGEDLDVDSAGRVYVADRGANAIRIYDSYDKGGALLKSIPIAAPTSVTVLPLGEIAVARTRQKRLVEVFDAQGKLLRDFGDLSDLAEHKELNRFLNVGRLVTDTANHLYYAFTYLPEPTVRKYDRFGYVSVEIRMATIEYAPAAEARRRAIWQQDQRSGVANFKPVVNAVGVDAATEEVWVAFGDQLLHFDRDGSPKGTYRTFTADGARVEPVSILVEPNRLLLAADPLGVYEFARPIEAGTPAASESAAAGEKKPQ